MSIIFVVATLLFLAVNIGPSLGKIGNCVMGATMGIFLLIVVVLMLLLAVV